MACFVKAPTWLTPLANGFCFGEGPRWFEGLLWFSDMLGEAVHTVDLQGDMTTLPLAGHAPSGLGFRPDGSLLIASTENRQVLRYDGETVTASPTCPTSCPRTSATWWSTTSAAPTSDRRRSRAASSCGSTPTRRSPSSPTISTSPTGWSSRPTGTTLIVAESIGRRLTAFTIGADGSLSDRRVFADGLDGPPDGITLDAEGGVWAAMTLANQFERIVEGGNVTDRIDIG